MCYHLSKVSANLEVFLGDKVIEGFVNDVYFKKGRTTLTLYDLKWEGVEEKYFGMVRLNIDGKKNFIQDQKIRTEVSLEVPENFDPSFDYVTYLKRKKIYIVGKTKEIKVVGNKVSISYYLSKINNTIIGKIRKIYNEPEASLLLGLVTGYRADFDEEFNESLSKTGTTHIIAISGFNISLIIRTITRIKRCVGRVSGLLITIVVAMLFCILTGACPSIVRATIMALVVLIGKEFGRESYPSILLFLTAALMAFFDPNVLWDLSFQLSFLSTVGLIYLNPILSHFLKCRKSEYVESLTCTVAAFITTLPIIVGVFGQFSILVFLSNFLILPVVSLSTVLGLINVFLALVNLELGTIFSFFSEPLLKYIIFVIESLSKSPISIVEVNFGVSFAHIFIYYLFLVIIVLFDNYKESLN